jgi:membrane-associated phospholipid phosphatase
MRFRRQFQTKFTLHYLNCRNQILRRLNFGVTSVILPFPDEENAMNTQKAPLAMLLLALLTPASAAAQETPQDTPDQPSPGAPPSVPAPSAPFERPISWKKLIPNVASDQKEIWLLPVRLAHGKNWIPTAAVVGATAGLVALDPLDGRYFRRTSSFGGFNRVFPGSATFYAIVATPVALYSAGLLRKDSKMRGTALLAAEAMGDSYLVATVMKDIDRRLQPIAIAPNGDFAHSWFADNNRYGLSDGSFPSGHTIAAFSAATVIARRYGNHRWVPYVAYPLAALVGFSRITLSAHFISDVFMGGALGYTISRFSVLRQ